MTKKEKLAIILTITMIITFITSEIYLAIKNKPQGYSFRIERMYYNLITKNMK